MVWPNFSKGKGGNFGDLYPKLEEKKKEYNLWT